MSATRLREAGFGDSLVSVTPPSAEISPRSNLSPDSLGKAPGRHTEHGWVGYSFIRDPVDVDEIEQSGANVGLLARKYPGLDLDVDDSQLAKFVQQEALKVLGPAPIRTSREPRRLLVYRTDDPFTKIRCKITYRGKEHVVECLADGQQYVIHGQHPSGVEYGWDGPALWEYPADPTTVCREAILDFFTHLKRRLKGRAEVQVVGTGETKDALAPPQDELRAPSYEALASAVASIPNREDSREGYIFMGHAIKAAGGPHAESIFHEWASRWEDGDNDPDTVAADWRRMHGPYRVGWPWIVEQAAKHGYSAAQDEFEVVEGAEPPTNPNRLPVESAVDFMREKIPPITYLVDGVIARGRISILSASPKAGKSTLARLLAARLTTGEDWLGFKVKRSRVLYLALEEHRDDVIRDLHLYDMDPENLDLYVGEAKLLEVLATVPGYDLVVLDTLFEALAVKDGNAYTEVLEKLKPIKHSAHRTGCAYLCVYHSRKGGGGRDAFEGIMGSNGIWAQFDAGIMYDRSQRGPEYRTMEIRGRPHVVDGKWTVRQEEDGTLVREEFIEDRPPGEEHILAHAKIEGAEGVTMKDLAAIEGCPVSESTLRRNMTTLMARGEMEEVPDTSHPTMYRLVEAANEFTTGEDDG